MITWISDLLDNQELIKAIAADIAMLISVIAAAFGIKFKIYKKQKKNGGTTYDMVRKLLDKIEKLEKELKNKKDKGAK